MIPADAYVDLVRRALAEDLGQAGDITSQACVPESTRSVGSIVARAEGIVAGLEVAAYVFAAVDPEVAFETRAVGRPAHHSG